MIGRINLIIYYALFFVQQIVSFYLQKEIHETVDVLGVMLDVPLAGAKGQKFISCFLETILEVLNSIKLLEVVVV